jgi:hypothetical protein
VTFPLRRPPHRTDRRVCTTSEAFSRRQLAARLLESDRQSNAPSDRLNTGQIIGADAAAWSMACRGAGERMFRGDARSDIMPPCSAPRLWPPRSCSSAYDGWQPHAALDRDDTSDRSCRHLIQETAESLIIPSLALVEVDYWIPGGAISGCFALGTLRRCSSYLRQKTG